MTFQHGSFRTRFYERAPGVCAAVVDVELEADAAVEDVDEFALDLAGDLEERWRAEVVCVYIQGVSEMVLVDGNS